MNRINFTNLLLFVALLLLLSCGENTKKTTSQSTVTEEQMVQVNRVLVKKDRQKITGFIERNGWNMTESATGFWYEILNGCKGDSAKKDLLATVSYKISLLDGTVCYTSENDGLKTFIIGKGNVESGLEQGILLMCEGTEARFIFPPHMAWGLPGDGKKIPARSIIVYEVELLSLIKP